MESPGCRVERWDGGGRRGRVSGREESKHRLLHWPNMADMQSWRPAWSPCSGPRMARPVFLRRL